VFIGGLIQVSYGAYSMTHMEAWLALFNPNVVFNPQAWDAFLLGEAMPEMGTESLIVWNIRLPRVFVAVPRRDEPRRLGAIFQAVTRNELASPFILGVSSGAGLMILLTLVVFGSLTAFLPLIAAFGGAGAFLIVYVIAWKNGTSPVRLVLARRDRRNGLRLVADGAVFLRGRYRRRPVGHRLDHWVAYRDRLGTSPTRAPVDNRGRSPLYRRLATDERPSCWASRRRSRWGCRSRKCGSLSLGVAVLAAAASIAVAGIVGFVGLIVPHMVRNLVGSDSKKLIIGCLFVGPALMVAADVGARLALSPTQIPVGIVTGLIGGPYFLYLMRKQESMGEI